MIPGGTAMVTGFSFVLYSRLYLIVKDRRILRTVLTPISLDAVAFTVPLAVAFYGLDLHDLMKFLSLILPADRLCVITLIGCQVFVVCLDVLLLVLALNGSV